MKLITCTGYFATGSSAITDYFSEFSNCTSIGNYEVRFIHDPNGVRDLEYNLVENNNRHNSSHAIKQFIKYTNHLDGNFIRKGYKRYFGESFKYYTDEYINHITELCCETWWHYDEIVRGELFNDIDIIYRKIWKKINKESMSSLLQIFHEKGYYTAISEEKFIQYTHDYIYSLLNVLNKDKNEFMIVDQLLPPTNVDQYLKHFDDIKVFIVDRDPRDLYLLEAERFRTGVTPYKNIKDFCKWYEIIRRNEATKKYDSSKVMHIKFEDLIYEYNHTSKALAEFVGISLDAHTKPLAYLDPKKSINNTYLEKKYPHRKKEIDYIKQHLSEYIYPFEQYE